MSLLAWPDVHVIIDPGSDPRGLQVPPSLPFMKNSTTPFKNLEKASRVSHLRGGRIKVKEGIFQF